MGQVYDEVCNFNKNMRRERLAGDTKVSKRGLELRELMSNSLLCLLNGRTKKNIPGHFTFVTQSGQSTIDLVFANQTQHFLYLTYLTQITCLVR